MSEQNKKTEVTLPEGFNRKNIEVSGTLPSGKEILIKKGKGRHLRSAQRMMSEGSSNSDLAHALASYLCAVDGKMLSVEAFDDMNIKDCAAIESYFLDIASASIKS